MKINDSLIKLNNSIFNGANFTEFEQTLSSYIDESNLLDSESSYNKLKTIYYWLYFSINDKSTSPQEKGLFFIKYDKYLSDTFNRRINITKKTDKYQAQALIIDFPKTIISDFERVIDSFNTIDQLPIIEKDIKKIMFTEDHRLIFNSFLKDELIDKSRISGIFRLSINYLNSEDIGRKDSYKSVKSEIKRYIEDAEKNGTYFSLNLLIVFADKLLKLINSDFDKTNEGDPAEIIIVSTEKKYPFYKRDHNINVEIQISNSKIGTAYDFHLFVDKHSDSISIPKKDLYYGNIDKGKVIIELKIINNFPSNSIRIEGYCTWNDLDDSNKTSTYSIDFLCQKENIDWGFLSKNRPYNLEPISTAEKLIGRIDIINSLTANIQSDNIESYIIYGQKRTGKTSIVKTFETLINNLKNNSSVCYIDGGDIAYPEASDIISNLGFKMCDFIRSSFKQVSLLEVPEFNGVLAPIDTFLSTVISIIPDIKIIFIIDEFDEFTYDLYKGKYADSFFQTIRSISSKPNFGFILVGGEKMEVIKKHQGYRLNKFKLESITYFDKESNYLNFIQLIRKPLSGNLEITDEGIALLYDYTSGNPYFTKLICIKIIDIMLSRKDSSITVKEVEEGIHQTLKTIASNSFHHFWMDGILQEESRKDDLFDDRRKYLLSFTEALREGNPTKERIIEIGENNYYLKKILGVDLFNEFVRRDVFVRESNEIHCKVKLFEKWLIDKGINEIITSSSCTDSILKEKLLSEQDYVKSNEIYDLLKSWGTYKGKSITEDIVRTWLFQFGEITNQRLAFNLLKSIKFYNSTLIREKLSTAFSIVIRGLNRFEKERLLIKGQSTRKDLLVSYLDEPAKSGAYYAKLFADENNIFHQNVIEKNKIITKIKNPTDNINGLIFIDDFIGTGRSITENLNELFSDDDLLNVINEKEIIIFIIAISGFSNSKEAILKKFSDINFLEVSICDPLSESDKVFNEDSKFFQSTAERLKTRDLVTKFGEILEKNHPLGYHDSQANIVFDQSCPNNTLPIFWKEKKTWIPLFKR
jgi:hypothetical protein